MRVCVAGATGAIGSVLVPGLAARGHHVVALDRADPGQLPPGVRTVVGDVREPAVLDTALQGCDAVAHLASVPDEAPLDVVLDSHVLTTGALLEACRRHGVSRVVLASSNHAVGHTPRVELPGDLLTADVRPRPDTFYGVGKVAMEALGSLYADRYGLEVVCMRIGSFAERPRSRRHLATWLSPGDAVRLVDAAFTARDVRFSVVYGISANTRAWWDLGPARELGYRPHDDAEIFAGAILAEPASDLDTFEATYVGGAFVQRHRAPGREEHEEP